MFIMVLRGGILNKDIKLAMGARIREKRKLHGYTKDVFAEMIDISPNFLAEIESGKKGMSFNTLIKISNALCVSCDYLLMGKEDFPKDRTAIDEILEHLEPEYYPIAEKLLRAIVEVKNISYK